MKILVAGIYRSGSTWLFNAVRLLAKKKLKESYSGFILWELQESDCHVIKTHAFYQDEELGFVPDVVLTSFRNKGEIRQSMKRQLEKGLEEQFKNAGNFKELDVFLGWLSSWRNHPSHKYEMSFKDLESKRIISILKDLNEALDFNLKFGTLLDVALELNELTPPSKGFDSVTLLTPTHPKK